MADNIRVIKGIKNSQGALFDIYEDQFDRFMDNYDHVFNGEGDRIEFVVDRCQELPELQEDDISSSGQGWRTDNDQGYNDRGSYGGSSYGGSSRGGYRGGYDGGRGSRGGRGNRGGYGGNRDDYQPRMVHQQSYEPEEDNSSWRGNGGGYQGGNDDGYRQKPAYQPQSSYDGGRGGGRGYRGGSQNQYTQDRHQQQPSFRSERGGGQQMYQQKSRSGFDDQAPAQTTHQVFITNLPSDYNEQSMRDLFRDFKMKPIKAKLLYDDSGKSKCAGFVEFGSANEAQEAVKNANNMNVDGGKRLNVQLAKK